MAVRDELTKQQRLSTDYNNYSLYILQYIAAKYVFNCARLVTRDLIIFS